MTITDNELARFRQLMTELEQLVGGPAPLASTDPDGTPAHVAYGELIESAWGNAVVDNVKFLRYHMPWASPAVELSGGWGSGLRQIGGISLPAIPATYGPYQATVTAHYICAGSAGGGADLTGGTTRTRFRMSPGVDSGISFIRTATSDQQVMVEVFGISRAGGAGATQIEIWTETSKPCNVSGGASATMIALGGV